MLILLIVLIVLFGGLGVGLGPTWGGGYGRRGGIGLSGILLIVLLLYLFHVIRF